VAAAALRLLAVTAELHVFAGVTNWDQPLRLGIALEGRAFLRVCEQRGDSIGFDDRPLEPADLGEGGRVEVHDLTERLGPNLRGVEIASVRAIEQAEGSITGLALIRADGPAFCIWVNDDEFRWGDAAALAAADRSTGRRSRFGAAL
jgi:hypothetical protein